MTERIRYILDTNVLLYDPNALQAFPDGEVIVPITVIEEIDQFKKEMSETGRNARLVSKIMDEFRQTGSLALGLPQPNGSLLRVYVWNRDDVRLPPELDHKRSGNRVLGCALLLKEESGAPLILVSQDTNIRIKANALGVDAISYEGESGTAEELYTGYVEALLDPQVLEGYRRQTTVEWPGEFFPNQGLVLRNPDNPDDFLVYR
ncbi:MAG TPA: PIN domain-containing protein, partial [bacterium]|nr:PIN domain-containing protein [bacterium]